MAKLIIVRLKKAGNRVKLFSVKDNFDNSLIESISKEKLIKGINVTIEDNVQYIKLQVIGKNACNKQINIPITTITDLQLASWQYEPSNTSSTWTHITKSNIYNFYYGYTSPYIIEYPFAYKFQDEILQNVKDYTKVFYYVPSIGNVFSDVTKVETNDRYFNKAILYNDQQSSGLLELVPKPKNNMKEYLSYPKYNSDSKSIIYTKSDNFYQYNTFWAINENKTLPLFVQTCESLSIDKEINQESMNYKNTSFKKAPLRAKDSKVRHILDNRNDTHLVSQFVIQGTQISYK